MEMNVKTGTYFTSDGEETKENVFNYYTNLTMSKKHKFVTEATDLIVDDNYYSSIIKNLVFELEVVNIFTDVDMTEFLSYPNSLDRIEKFLKETNIANIVIADVEEGLIQSLRDSIEDNIAYKTGILKNPIEEALASILNTFEKKIENVNVDELMNMAKTVSSVTGDITPEKIMEAYSNTDMFKKNVEERNKPKRVTKSNKTNTTKIRNIRSKEE